MTNTTTETNTNDSRTEYGFRLSFPKTPFTQGDLRSFKKYAKVPYITIYKRIKAAVSSGELVVQGKKPGKTRGRPQSVYVRADSVAPTV
jgi:hypothetical protein